MNEELIQFSWMFRLYSTLNLRTTDNKVVEIIDPGQWNRDSGPDFFNAKVKIDKTIWAGNVEIHHNSKEWFLHQHHLDAAYNNVILHVVVKSTDGTTNQKGKTIPTLELPVYPHVFNNYQALFDKYNLLPCEQKVPLLAPFLMTDWLTSLYLEKMNQKYHDIKEVLIKNKNHWEEAFYVFLCRSFGAGKNSLPFELLAKSLPLKIINKHRDNLFQVEALMFGQAGFLDELLSEDQYINDLAKEYRFMAQKYGLIPIEKHLWKFLRLRPGNFPTVRIAQLAKLLNTTNQLFTTIINADNIQQIHRLLKVSATGYWKDHYRFNAPSATRTKTLGTSTINSIIINTIAPFIFAYGKEHSLDDFCHKSLAWLETIAPESNSIITKWQSIGYESTNAFETQALIQLTKEYCLLKKCIRCRIGHQIIAKQIE